MSSTDVIANTLVALRNAQAVGRERVAVPYSGFKERLLSFLKEKQIIAAVRTQEGVHAKLVVTLRYTDGHPVLRSVRRLSVPGRRLYVTWQAIPYIARGEGFVIVSTSAGLMDGETARQKHLGGELLCELSV